MPQLSCFHITVFLSPSLLSPPSSVESAAVNQQGGVVRQTVMADRRGVQVGYAMAATLCIIHCFSQNGVRR